MKKFLKIFLITILVISSIGCIYATSEDVVLKITPNHTSLNLSNEAQKIIYTVEIIPKEGIKVGSFDFTFNVPKNMTLSKIVTSTQDGAGYWIKDLEYNSKYNPEGIFSSASYTAENNVYIAYGTTEERNLNKETLIMTIEATIDSNATGEFVLGTKVFNAGDILGNETYSSLKVDSTPVVISGSNDEQSEDSNKNDSPVVDENEDNNEAEDTGINNEIKDEIDNDTETKNDEIKTDNVDTKDEQKIDDKEDIKEDDENKEVTWKNPFTDVKETDWFYNSIKYADENGIFNGMTATTFGPNVSMTRGMIVTVLYRLEGKPTTNKDNLFVDVSSSMYYADAISWAKQNGIVNGVDDKHFAPDAEVTREQLISILYRYAQAKDKNMSSSENVNLSSYGDFAKISEYAVPAMKWGSGAGIITGRTTTTIAPKGTATRAEVATMIMRFIKGL